MAIGTAFAIASGVASLYGAHAKKKGRLGEADSYDDAARDSLLTAKFNIRKRDEESKEKQFSTFEQGARALNQVAIEGQKHQEEIKTESAGSGALISSGTTLDVMMTDAINNTVQQLSVVDATRDAMTAEERSRKNANEAEWRNAQNRASNYEKRAESTRKSAQDAYVADVISTIAQTGANMHSAGAFSSSSSPSPSLDANDAQKLHGAPKDTNWSRLKKQYSETSFDPFNKKSGQRYGLFDWYK